MVDVTRTCKRCAVVFVLNASHQKFCSTDCRHAARNEARRKPDYVPVEVGGLGTCARCATEFVVTRPTKRFCSERCRKRAERARRRRRYPEKHPKHNYVPVSRESVRVCAASDCVAEFVTSERSIRKYCSERCKARENERKKRVRRANRPCSVEGCEDIGYCSSGLCYMHADRRKRGIPFDRPKYAQPKLRKNPQVCTADGCSKPTYWRRLCKRHYLKLKASEGVEWAILAYDAGGATGVRNKTDVYGGSFEVVNRFAVYERDGWVCQLCGEPVDPDLKGPDPMCASIDHVVPLSHGGDHSMENTQLAHLGCNSAKGNRV